MYYIWFRSESDVIYRETQKNKTKQNTKVIKKQNWLYYLNTVVLWCHLCPHTSSYIHISIDLTWHMFLFFFFLPVLMSFDQETWFYFFLYLQYNDRNVQDSMAWHKFNIRYRYYFIPLYIQTLLGFFFLIPCWFSSILASTHTHSHISVLTAFLCSHDSQLSPCYHKWQVS